MTGEQDGERSGEMRRVFEGPDGYYVEGKAGDGPTGHDDVEVTPSGIEDKQAAAVPAIVPPDWAERGERDGDDRTTAYLVLMPGGSLVQIVPPGRGAWARAYQRAGECGGLIVGAPVLADCRRPEDRR